MDLLLGEVGPGALCMFVSFLGTSGAFQLSSFWGLQRVLLHFGIEGGPPVCAFL